MNVSDKKGLPVSFYQYGILLFFSIGFLLCVMLRPFGKEMGDASFESYVISAEEMEDLVSGRRETENLLENSREKLIKKKADMIIANNLKTEGAGFGTDTNVITIITENNIKKLSKMSKEKAACEIINEVLK